LKITLLGTGTSQGVPVIGCNCSACLSRDPRDERSRCSVHVQEGDSSIVIDVGPDFRMQMLKAQVTHLDAVLLTHEHNDHIIGLDDLRPFLFRSQKSIHIHGEERVLNDIQHRFQYAFIKQPYPGAPEFKIQRIIPDISFKIESFQILPLRLIHGRLPILGFRIGNFAYLTDTNQIPDSTMSKLTGLEILVIDALRKKSHHSHFSLKEATQIIKDLNPEKAYLTHISHLMGPASEWESDLAKDIYPAYDGLQFEL